MRKVLTDKMYCPRCSNIINKPKWKRGNYYRICDICIVEQHKSRLKYFNKYNKQRP